MIGYGHIRHADQLRQTPMTGMLFAALVVATGGLPLGAVYD